MKQYSNFNEMFVDNNNTNKKLSVFNNVSLGHNSIWLRWDDNLQPFCRIEYHKDDTIDGKPIYNIAISVYESGEYWINQVRSLMVNLGLQPHTYEGTDDILCAEDVYEPEFMKLVHDINATLDDYITRL